MSLSSKIDSNVYGKFVFGPWVEPSPRWVRVKFGSEIIADSKQVLLLIKYSPGRLPTYYFPQADVRMDVRTPSSRQDQKGEVAYWTANFNRTEELKSRSI